MELDTLTRFSMSPVELMFRGSVVYWFLFMTLRFVLRRDMGTVGLNGILFLVLLGDASQTAMIGEGTTLADGLLLIATLAGWNLFLDFCSYRFPIVQRLMLPKRLPLYANGQRNRHNMRRQLITDAELESALRVSGLATLADAEAVYLEPSGEISVVERKKKG